MTRISSDLTSHNELLMYIHIGNKVGGAPIFLDFAESVVHNYFGMAAESRFKRTLVQP